MQASFWVLPLGAELLAALLGTRRRVLQGAELQRRGCSQLVAALRPALLLCPLPAVQSCEPPVAAMADLLARLNGGDSFSRFVRCMRQEFQAVVRAEMQQQQQPAAAAPPLAAH